MVKAARQARTAARFKRILNEDVFLKGSRRQRKLEDFVKKVFNEPLVPSGNRRKSTREKRDKMKRKLKAAGKLKERRKSMKVELSCEREVQSESTEGMENLSQIYENMGK